MEEPVLTHVRVLGPRLYLHMWVRLIALATLLFGSLFARYVLAIDVDTMALVGVSVFIAGYNAVAYFLLRRADRHASARRAKTFIMHTAIVLDFLSLTVVIGLLGGARSPFLTFYILHVILGCLLLSRRTAITHACLAFGLLTLLVAGEYAGLLRPDQPQGVVGGTGPIDGQYALTVIGVTGVLIGITTFLLVTLAAHFRAGERLMHDAHAEVNRVAEMRREFLRITQHNLQSPLATTSMHLQNLRDELGGPVTEKQAQWLDRSLQRLAGLVGFLHDLRTMSVLETDGLDDHATPVELPPMLTALVDEYQDVARTRHQHLDLDLPSVLPPVRGIERLVRESIVNYITNALKYTPDGGHVTVRAYRRARLVRVEVEDDGMGIAAEDQPRLFHDYVRLAPRDAAHRQIAGTGLGLSIVRRIVEAHGGTVGVKSVVDAGSTFHLELPVHP